VPGVRPVGIGEIFRRLFAKAILLVVGREVKSASDNLNLCAGLKAGIEGGVHAKNASHILVDYPSNISQKKGILKIKKTNTRSAMQPVGYVLQIINLTPTVQNQLERVPLTDAS
jgi:hypothetical protein